MIFHADSRVATNGACMHCFKNLLLQSWIASHPNMTVEFENAVVQTELSWGFQRVSSTLGQQFLGLRVSLVPLLYLMKPSG
jgi:hypothetical protein